MTEAELLVPLDTYLKSGIHIGTKFKTKYMENFIYKARSDGLFVLNLQKIDERIGILINMLKQYDPKDILVVSRRENSWRPVKMFGKFTGIDTIPGRYAPGMLTNLNLDTFIEKKLIFVTDAWPDFNVVKDGMISGATIVALCDTNNQSNYIDLCIPCNNKGKKSLGLIFWIITKEYMKAKGMIKSDDEFKATIEDFTEP